MSAPSAGRRALVVAGVLFALLLVAGAVPRLRRKQELEARTKVAEAAPTVRVIAVKRAAAGGELRLPGTVQAMREAALYPRSSGYVRRYNVDIGAKVGAGTVLAVIETPEVDQELAQARASLGQVRAAYGLANSSLERWRSMVKDSAATRQELDEREAAFAAATANVAASEANVRRLQELQGFGRVTAPFAGRVTARNIEVGQLVSPSQGSRPLFTLVQADTGRIMINIPEGAASQVHAGTEADVTMSSSGTKFTGRIVRTAGALDPTTRTMLAEVQVPNPSGALLPGMYAQVRLSIHNATPGVLLPANALIVRAAGPQVAMVRDGKVHLVKVQLGRDLGTEIEITSGIDEGALVIVNPSDDVSEGAEVTVAVAEPPKSEAKSEPAKTAPTKADSAKASTK